MLDAALNASSKDKMTNAKDYVFFLQSFESIALFGFYTVLFLGKAALAVIVVF
jgi:hypothetical protein